MMSRQEREIGRDQERLAELRSRVAIHQGPSPKRIVAPDYKPPKGGRLGKRAQKAYAGTMRGAPADATIGSRVTRGTSVKVISTGASPGLFYRLAERGIQVPA